ncbi:MAG: 4-(cytidine 5'-diphospho)-2-C-methyl-D-erythritol kinase [Bacteroidetes bacterium]|nr:MAG: 4-(cytidine 5'-diphospho)-2-C-methyl-D-erythritol kinase [Bacteroidota bacterium]MBL1145186.1 4-(cytidine 5'-diphospho)-2-C-methyl-D-erythritol kinase [Bacteroidota bacterium]NOG57982.1 4-(cytidine 5'-diphospho)-2-C-methyl-D-erythritol kinase [Bacteroidota bacterium]
MKILSNAKINLGLNIISKRLDGFHEIESVFIPIDFSDVLFIEKSKEFSFKSKGIQIQGDIKSNLCVRAYQLLAADFDIEPVTILLDKKIPIGAGLGGGSSNAAFVLKAINSLFHLNLDTETLRNYASKLGSDCAFFIENKPALASGRGEILKPIMFKLNCWCLLVYPNIHVSTQVAYSKVKPKQPEINLEQLIQNSKEGWQSTIKNDFEPSVFANYPLINELKQSIIEMGAFYSAMSGSGSSVFGFFNEKVDASILGDKYIVEQFPINIY